VGELLDVDDLVDAEEASRILGLANPRAVSVYQRRYEDFPRPAVSKGRCRLWRRSAIEGWVALRRDR